MNDLFYPHLFIYFRKKETMDDQSHFPNNFYILLTLFVVFFFNIPQKAEVQRSKQLENQLRSVKDVITEVDKALNNNRMEKAVSFFFFFLLILSGMASYVVIHQRAFFLLIHTYLYIKIINK